MILDKSKRYEFSSVSAMLFEYGTLVRFRGAFCNYSVATSILDILKGREAMASLSCTYLSLPSHQTQRVQYFMTLEDRPL